MLLRCVTVSLVVGVCLYDMGFRDLICDQFFYPRCRDDIQSMLLSCVKLDCNLTLKAAAYTLKNLLQSLCGKILCKIYGGFFSGTVLIRNVMFSTCSRYDFFVCHL